MACSFIDKTFDLLASVPQIPEHWQLSYQQDRNFSLAHAEHSASIALGTKPDYDAVVLERAALHGEEKVPAPSAH